MPGKIRTLLAKYRKTIIQFVKFNFVGISNTLLDWGVFAILNMVFSLQMYIAKPISFTCGVINSFILNKFWTFKKQQQSFKGLELIKFLVINLISLGINLPVLYLLKTGLGINETLGNILITPITFIINFFFYKFWVFKSPEK